MNDWSFCCNALREVSRTFSKPIELLPDALRRQVTCAYLLCRVADTIEDHSALELSTRDRAFAELLACLESGASPALLVHLFKSLPDDAEVSLGRELPRVLSVYAGLPEDARAACRTWVAEMVRGMTIYSHRPAGDDGLRALHTLPDLERYCYFVAGTVGRLLTHLFLAKMPGIDPQREQTLWREAEEFGLALQLVNIVKDVVEDRARGVSYLPRQLVLDAGATLETLLRPEGRVAAHAALAPVIARARRALDGALRYVLAVPSSETAIRLFCMLPTWMAARTLALALDNDDLFDEERKLKISRTEVASLVADCIARVSDDDKVRTGFALVMA